MVNHWWAERQGFAKRRRSRCIFFARWGVALAWLKQGWLARLSGTFAVEICRSLVFSSVLAAPLSHYSASPGPILSSKGISRIFRVVQVTPPKTNMAMENPNLQPEKTSSNGRFSIAMFSLRAHRLRLNIKTPLIKEN